jgi:hypothetical protein
MRPAAVVALIGALSISAARAASEGKTPTVIYRWLIGERWVREKGPDGPADVNNNFSFTAGAEIVFGRWGAGYNFSNYPGYGYPGHGAAVQEHEFYGAVVLAGGRGYSWRLAAGPILSRANFTEEGVEPMPGFGKSSFFLRPSAATELAWFPNRRQTLGGRLRYRRRVKAANWSYRPSSYGLSCDSLEARASWKFFPWPVFSADVVAAAVRDGAARGFGPYCMGEVYPPATEFHLYAGGTFYLSALAERR